MDAHTLAESPEIAEKVIKRLRAGMMPPPGQPRPDWNAYTALTEQLESSVDTTASINPGACEICLNGAAPVCGVTPRRCRSSG